MTNLFIKRMQPTVFTEIRKVFSGFMVAVFAMTFIVPPSTVYAGQTEDPEEGPVCEAVVVVSDTDTMVGTTNAESLSFIHSAWTANIPGATWIWESDPVSDPVGTTTVTFTRSFEVTGIPTAGSLDVASDNSYSVSLNGLAVGADDTKNNFQSGTQDNYDVSSYLVQGTNTLAVTVTNWATEEGTPESNPAGLLFRLSAEQNCAGSITVYKEINNYGGGTMELEEFEFFVGDTEVEEGVAHEFTMGSYTVSENRNSGDGDFEATFSGDCDAEGMVQLGAGEDKTCTITNTYVPPVIQNTCEGGENLVANGGFETPIIGEGKTWDLFVDGYPGLYWGVEWMGSGEGTPLAELQRGVYSPHVQGEQYTELGTTNPVKLSQMVPTIPGEEYAISFAYAPRPGQDKDENELRVFWDGKRIKKIKEDGTGSSSIQWKYFEFTKKASGSETEIRFQDNGDDPLASYGPFIDDVCVTHIAKNTISGYKFNDKNGNEQWDKQDGEEGIEGWQVVVKRDDLKRYGKKLNIHADDMDGKITSKALESGRLYLVEAKKVWTDLDGDRKVDAEYYTDNNWDSHGDRGVEPYRDVRQLDLIMDEANVDWGSYSDDHLYKVVVEGTGAFVNFRIYDEDYDSDPPSWREDNDGKIEVRIYDVTDYVATTDEEGYFSIGVRPGVYQVVEVMQEGWLQTYPTHPSYYHEVDVTEGDATGIGFGNMISNHAPVIDLIGSSTVTLYIGDAYAEEGATVSDVEEGDITGNLVIGGDTVDTGNVGTYLVTYNAQDSEGVPADEVTRTVEVISRCTDGLDNDEDDAIDEVDSGCEVGNPNDNDENSQPVIALLGNNPLTHAYGSPFSEPGYTADDAEDGDISGDVVVGGDTVDEYTEDTYILSYDVSDSDGLPADTVYRTVYVVSSGGSTPAQCEDGADNDGDGFADYPADPGCESSVDNDESDDPEVLGASTSTVPTTGGETGTTTATTTEETNGEEEEGEVLGESCGMFLTSYMGYGKDNDSEEVMKLQEFLNEEMDAGLPITGYFGPLTHESVKAFQLKYAEEILQPWVDEGLLEPGVATGYVYKTTLRWINLLKCKALELPVPELK